MRRPPPSDFVAHGARNRNGEHELLMVMTMMRVMKVILMVMVMVLFLKKLDTLATLEKVSTVRRP